ncbi:hypothetical protein B5M44_14085 [Shinella sumterensis]|uniref:hypothetical protein n=1 Tax=Shinella sumterensis TaxID=1967501 RepID=UPI00106DD8D5|nr:hypothetical protein [Shinella sumterensis]MCD1264263.1 hypothetical protein [Shinella sumterensis]TFE97731.1 hypothetical protein B5M44_14085 [Shinella sumterensis]
MSYDLEKMIDNAIDEGIAIACRVAAQMAASVEIQSVSGPAALLMFVEAVRIEHRARMGDENERPN